MCEKSRRRPDRTKHAVAVPAIDCVIKLSPENGWRSSECSCWRRSFSRRVSHRQRGTATGPKAVTVHNGWVTLHGLLWRPPGHGAFPAILLNHSSGARGKNCLGSARMSGRLKFTGHFAPVMAILFLFLFRRGVGLSADQGASATN